MKTILFSPVGGTDPISQVNIRDGSLLHIARVYQPDEIIMYMSKEVLAYHNTDNRYAYCLNKLDEMQGRHTELRIIERPELTKVHEFDFFYKDFLEIIKGIYSTMEPDDVLLYNVSSGTPAMKSGLLVLQTLGEYPGKLIQVSTPERKMNEHIHSDYDVESLWELNEDNAETYENRCREISCPSLTNIKQQEMIRSFILKYDYRAAAYLANALPDETTRNYRQLIQAGMYRMELDRTRVDRLLAQQNDFALPLRSGNERKYFEYALSVQIKLKREDYADFIRSLTPLIGGLFELVLSNEFQIDLNTYKTPDGRWDRKALAGSELLSVLESQSPREFQYGFIYSAHLKKIITYYSKDPVLTEITENLRSVEEKVRNLAAHTITAITKDTIVEKTGFQPNKIMADIKKLFAYTGIKVKAEYWESYDALNDLIITKMGEV